MAPQGRTLFHSQPEQTQFIASIMAARQMLLLAAAFVTSTYAAENLTCPDYSVYAGEHHAPFSAGRFNLSSQRPVTRCRTFNSSVVESKIEEISSKIVDPDLKRLFENSFPNTLDTAVKWKGYANNTDEELTFLITGGAFQLDGTVDVPDTC